MFYTNPLFDSSPVIEPKERHKIATVLHPLLKNLPKLNETEKDDAYRIVDRLVKQANDASSDAAPMQAAKRQRKFKEDFLNDFCKIEGKLRFTLTSNKKDH